MEIDKSRESIRINTLYSFNTECSADSVEWCPHEPFHNVFVCANYQLTEEQDDNTPRKREGKILLFSISHERGLKLHQTIDTAAVLDQKWCHCKINNYSLLGVVNAQKTIQVYKIDPNLLELQLVTYFEIEDDDNETLILSLDWSTGKYHSNDPEIICSDSKGNIHIFQLCNSKLILKSSWNAHNFEAWIAGFYYWDPNIVFTGGDDSMLCKFDKRVGDRPLLKNKTHQAGVTSYHSNSKKEHIIATGSYDENLRLWDIRNMKYPINEIKLPGPLWRVKFDPFSNNFILVAAMLGGVHIVDTNNIENLEVVASYYEHKNIAYGADWSYLNECGVKQFNHNGSIIIGSCSFYDHMLCVSKFESE